MPLTAPQNRLPREDSCSADRLRAVHADAVRSPLIVRHRHAWLLCCGLVGSVLTMGPVAAVHAADAEPAKAAGEKSEPAKGQEGLGQRRDREVGKHEELGHLQEKVSAQMVELEERMFRLSEALKNLEPENASRLLIGLKYAREELIQLQMRDIQSALTTQKYKEALNEQKTLINKLRRLEQLLLSPDLDFQLQLERLRLMRDLLRRMDAVVDEEVQEKANSDQAAKDAQQLKEVRQKIAALKEVIARQTAHNRQSAAWLNEPDAESVRPQPRGDDQPLDALTSQPPMEAPEIDPAQVATQSAEQQQTREQTKSLEKGVPPLATAGQSMERAQAALEASKVPAAFPEQVAALAALKAGLEELQRQERELEANTSANKFNALQKDQSANRKTTDGINELAIQLGEAGAQMRGNLTRGSASMQSAEGRLGGQQAGEASDDQAEAIAALKGARRQLAAEEEKLLNRLRAEIKKRTLEGLQQMLEGQVAVRQSTERLAPRAATGGRAVLNSITALAGQEQKLIVIGDGLTALVEETEFGIALPAALRSITEGMAEVKEALAATNTSPETIEAQKQIEQDLEDLLAAMKQLPANGGEGNGRRSNNSPSERERQLNKIIAELRIVRLLQVRLNRDTKETDEHRPTSAEITAALTKKIEQLRGRQEDVHDVTERIAIERGDELPEPME